TRSMANEGKTDRRAMSLEDVSVTNLNKTISISNHNEEAKGATRKGQTKNSNMDKTKSKLKIIEDKKINLLDEEKGMDGRVGQHSGQNEARCLAEDLRGDIVPDKMKRAVDCLNEKFNLLLENFENMMKVNNLSNRNLPSEGGGETTDEARSVEVNLLNEGNFENNFVKNKRNRINIEKQNSENFEIEKLIVENGNGNHGDNIVENSRVETLIAGPRIEKNILGTGHSRLEMRSCHTLVEDADAWRLGHLRTMDVPSNRVDLHHANRENPQLLGMSHAESVSFTPALDSCRKLNQKSLTKGRSQRAMEFPLDDERFPCQTNEGKNLMENNIRSNNRLNDFNNFCNFNKNNNFSNFNSIDNNVENQGYGSRQLSNSDSYHNTNCQMGESQNLSTIIRVTFELPNGQVVTKIKPASIQECQQYLDWPDEIKKVHFSVSREPRQSVLQTVAWQNNSDNYFPHNRNRFERGRLSREDSSVNHEDELYNRESQLQYNTFSQPSQRRRNCSRQNFLGDSGQENIDEQTFQNESRYPILCQNNNELSMSSSINIGRIINTWNLAFPKDERDPEQFIMLLEDHLQTY
ncbi:hypothetical protein PV328_012304, partial [Microctonus aethiopoides]